MMKECLINKNKCTKITEEKQNITIEIDKIIILYVKMNKNAIKDKG